MTVSKTTQRALLGATTALALALPGAAAQAAFINGGIGFGGDFTGVDGGGAPVTDLNNAVRIETDDPNIFVTERSGDLADVALGTFVDSYEDFDLDASGTPFPTFWEVTGSTTTFSLELTTFTVTDRDAEFIDIEGSGFLKASGFDDTPATFTASFNSTDAVETFSSTTAAVSTPATMMLLGSGLIALGALGARTRKDRQA
jgi:hypothetical protein